MPNSFMPAAKGSARTPLGQWTLWSAATSKGSAGSRGFKLPRLNLRQVSECTYYI
jgi:hypothetical protein